MGLSGAFTLVPTLWADYYGRRSLGTIRGVALTAQMGGAAAGPLLAGGIYDLTASYQWAFVVLGVASLVGGLMALAARPPAPPHEAGTLL